MNFTVDLWDLLAFLGLWCVLAGLFWLHPGLGLVGLGVALAAVGILGAKRWVFLQRSSAAKPANVQAEADEV